MKKQLLVMLCALTLMTVSPAAAQRDYTATVGGASVLTVSYDDTALRLDTESYLSSSRSNHKWLGMFYNDVYTVDFSADRYDDLPAGCTVAQLGDYLCSRLTDAALLETYLSKGGVSYVLLQLSSPAGSSYYAATLSQGYAVHFEIYNPRGSVDANALTLLKTLLDGTGK